MHFSSFMRNRTTVDKVRRAVVDAVSDSARSAFFVRRVDVRDLTTFESQTGADLIRKEVLERARNAGLDTDRDFSDSKVHLRAREKSMSKEVGGVGHYD